MTEHQTLKKHKSFNSPLYASFIIFRTVFLAAFLIFALPFRSFAAGEISKSPCSICRGTGKILCTYCNGKGWAMARLRRFRNAEQPCRKCSQTGRRICFDCGGYGEIYEYPEPSASNTGWLKLNFQVKKKKNRPAPSWIEIVVDGKVRERIEGHGTERIYDFAEIPLAPGDSHRLLVRVHFNKSLGGFYDGEVFAHKLRIEPGMVTTTEGAKKALVPRDEARYEDWGEIFRGLYRNMEECGCFRIVPRGTKGSLPVYEPDAAEKNSQE